MGFADQHGITLEWKGMIFLDNNATTRMDERVREAMEPFFCETYGNPAGPYRFARKAATAVEQAREHVAGAVGVSPEAVVFTSGGTEANNAIIRAALAARPDRRRILVSAVEHASVLEPCAGWARRGYDVVQLPVDRDGCLVEEAWIEALDERVALVCLMGANNESGVCFDITTQADQVHAVGALFHSDITQCMGKVPIKLGIDGADYTALSAHKFHGPKGVGAMILPRRKEPWESWQKGGGQEKGHRAGTLNVPGIVGLGEAARLIDESTGSTMARLRDGMEKRFLEAIPELSILGQGTRRLPNTSLLHIAGADAEAVLARLDEEHICCSSGSACMAGSAEPSHVVEAMGLTGRQRYEVIRISLSRFTTDVELGTLQHILPILVGQIREIGASLDPPYQGAS